MEPHAKSKLSSNKGRRLGVSMRGALTDAYMARGHAKGKIWFQYSSIAMRDVALSSELDYLHFLLIEASNNVKMVDYNPTQKISNSIASNLSQFINAEITLNNGDVIWRHICPFEKIASAHRIENEFYSLNLSSAFSNGVPVPKFEILTIEKILDAGTLIQNWHTIAAWLAAGRDWALIEEQIEDAALIRSKGSVDFKNVLALGGGTEKDDLYGVALFRSLQKGVYDSNLSDAPFTMQSRFSRKLEVK